MKLLKLLAISSIFTFALFLPIKAAYAVDVLKPACDTDRSSTLCEENKSSGGQTSSSNKLYGKDSLLAKATSLISVLIGIAAVIMIIVGGFKYVLSNGNSEAINSAKNTIIYAVIGLVIALVAQGLIALVISKL